MWCCCMDWEYKYYESASKIYAKNQDTINQNGENYQVISINYISGEIKAKNQQDQKVSTFNQKDLKRLTDNSWTYIGGDNS